MIWVGLPVYNEASRINTLLMDIHKSLSRGESQYKIVVYDDGSSDDTVFKVLSTRDQGIKVHLTRGEENKGLGYALSYLIKYCAKISSLEDTIIIMDADATHNPEHIHRMLGYIQDGFDVVIASRYTPYSRIRGVKLHRQFLSNMVNLTFKLLFPIKGVSDYSCAYRAYTAKILKLAKDFYKDKLIEEHGFACMAEFLVKLRKLDIIVCEVPLILRYDKKSGPSKMNVFTTILRTLRLIFKTFFLPILSCQDIEGLREKYKIRIGIISRKRKNI